MNMYIRKMCFIILSISLFMCSSIIVAHAQDSARRNLTITSEPSSLHGIVGQDFNATFTASASGNVQLSHFKWKATALPTGLVFHKSHSQTSSVSNSVTQAGTFQLSLKVKAKDAGGNKYSGTMTWLISFDVPPPPSIKLNVAPATAQVVQGQSVTYDLLLVGSNGFQGTASISSTTSDSQIQATLETSDLGSGDETRLDVVTNESTPLGSYSITLTAKSGQIQDVETVTLTVVSKPSPSDVTITTRVLAPFKLNVAFSLQILADGFDPIKNRWQINPVMGCNSTYLKDPSIDALSGIFTGTSLRYGSCTITIEIIDITIIDPGRTKVVASQPFDIDTPVPAGHNDFEIKLDKTLVNAGDTLTIQFTWVTQSTNVNALIFLVNDLGAGPGNIYTISRTVPVTNGQVITFAWTVLVPDLCKQYGCKSDDFKIRIAIQDPGFESQNKRVAISLSDSFTIQNP